MLCGHWNAYWPVEFHNGPGMVSVKELSGRENDSIWFWKLVPIGWEEHSFSAAVLKTKYIS